MPLWPSLHLWAVLHGKWPMHCSSAMVMHITAAQYRLEPACMPSGVTWPAPSSSCEACTPLTLPQLLLVGWGGRVCLLGCMCWPQAAVATRSYAAGPHAQPPTTAKSTGVMPTVVCKRLRTSFYISMKARGANRRRQIHSAHVPNCPPWPWVDMCACVTRYARCRARPAVARMHGGRSMASTSMP